MKNIDAHGLFISLGFDSRFSPPFPFFLSLFLRSLLVSFSVLTVRSHLFGLSVVAIKNIINFRKARRKPLLKREKTRAAITHKYPLVVECTYD